MLDVYLSNRLPLNRYLGNNRCTPRPLALQKGDRNFVWSKQPRQSGSAPGPRSVLAPGQPRLNSRATYYTPAQCKQGLGGPWICRSKGISLFQANMVVSLLYYRCVCSSRSRGLLFCFPSSSAEAQPRRVPLCVLSVELDGTVTREGFRHQSYSVASSIILLSA